MLIGKVGGESDMVVLVGEVIGENVGEVLTCAARSVRLLGLGLGWGMKFAFHYHQTCATPAFSLPLNPFV